MIDEESKIWNRERYLKDRHWLDRETQMLDISMLLLNSQVEPLISHVNIHFEFTRGYHYTRPLSLSPS